MHMLKSLTIAALLFLPVRALADGLTILVPKQFATIQAGCDAAGDGDTVLVSSGTYTEVVAVANRTNFTIQGKGKVVIDTASGTGITLTDCTDCNVENIHITGSAPHGLRLDGCTGGTLFKVSVEAPLQDGIRLDACDGVTLDHCSVKLPGVNCISLAAGLATPTNNCTVSKCKLQFGIVGVLVNGNGNTIEDNVSTSSTFAYRVDTATVCTNNAFTGNKAVKSGLVGLVIEGTGNTCTDNVVTKAGDTGVIVNSGGACTLTGTKISKPAGVGIRCEAVVTSVTLTGSKISKPGADGILVLGDAATVTGNKSTGAVANGYRTDGDGGTWTGNTATGSTNDGFLLNGDTNTLSANVGKGNKHLDLEDLGTSNVVDLTNVFKTTN